MQKTESIVLHVEWITHALSHLLIKRIHYKNGIWYDK
jgi:hypothetical protein